MTTKLYKRPRDTSGALKGLYYKIGKFNRVFYFNGEEWMISQEYKGCAQDLLDLFDKMRDRFSLVDDVVRR